MDGRSEDDPEEVATGDDTGADAGPGTGDGDRDRGHGTDDESEEWRFGVEDVDEDGAVSSVVEAETPDLEHAVFVVLGALAMVLVFVHLWTLV